MFCIHDWRFPGEKLLDNAICNKCDREGLQWYDMLSGGVSARKNSQPTTDLRLVYPALLPVWHTVI